MSTFRAKCVLRIAVATGLLISAVALAADTVTLWSWRTEDQVAMRAIFDVFEAQSPDIKVDLQFTPDADYQNRLGIALRGGKGPDIAQLKAYGELQPLVEAGYLVPLNELVPAISEFPDTATGGVIGRADGKFYGVPYSVPVLGVFYNTDLFAQYNIAVPKTYQEFLAAAKVLKAAGITPIANGGAQGSAWELEVGVGTVGPGVYGADFYDEMMSGKATFEDPRFVAALARFAELGPYYSDGFAAVDYTAATQQFISGKAGMFFGGSWENGSFKSQNPDLNFSIFPFPGDEAEEHPVVSAFSDGSYGLVADSKHQAAAVKVLQFIASPEFAQLFADNLGWPAARPGVTAKNDPTLAAMIEMQANTTPYLTLVGYRWETPTASSILQAKIIDVVEGKVTPEALAKEMAEGVSTWFKPTN